MGQVGLDDVDVAAFDERRRIPDRMDPLAGRDRVVVAARTRRERCGDLGRDGLLDPARCVRFERDRDLGGGVRREAAVHLDHQVDVRSDRLAHRGDDRERPAAGRRRQPNARRTERVELHRPIAARDDAERQGRDGVGLEVGSVPAVGVGRDAVAESPAEELPDGHAERLADEVPRRDVERGQRGLAVLARAAVLESFDGPGEPFRVEWVRPDDVAPGQLLDDGDERVCLVDRPDLADADEPACRSRARRRRGRATASRRRWSERW